MIASVTRLFQLMIIGIAIYVLSMSSCHRIEESTAIDTYSSLKLKSEWVRLGDHKGFSTEQNPLASLLAAEFSPDMKYILSSSRGGSDVVLWHTKSGESAWEIILDLPTRAVKFSPDSKLMLAGGDYRSVKIWEVPSGKLIKELFYDGSVETIEYNHDGSLLATGDRSGKITLWNTQTWEIVNQAIHDGRTADPSNPRNDVNTVAFSNDGKVLLSGGLRGGLKKWSVPDLAFIDSIDYPMGSVKAIKPMKDGLHFAFCTGSPDYSVRITEINTFNVADSTITDFVVESIDFSKNEDFLLAGLSVSYSNYDSLTESIRVFDVTQHQGKPILIQQNGIETIRTKYLYFSPDGEMLVSAHMNGILQLWNVKYQN